MISVVIAYHSGFGHTKKVAEHVAKGAGEVEGVKALLIDVTEVEGQWEKLDQAHGIIFGAPTYMGGVSAPFKQFIDGAGNRWLTRAWKNKIAAGFTNSGSLSGDNLGALIQMMVAAMQHSMIWVGMDIMPPSYKGTDCPKPTDLNRMGSFTGLTTQSNNDSPDVCPPQGDLESARLFGRRVAEVTKHFGNAL